MTLTVYYANKATNYTGSDRVRNYREALEMVNALLIRGMTSIVIYNDKTDEAIFKYSG